MTLNEIAIKHNCDKSSLHHDYCRIYEKYFDKMPGQELFEIGYGGGASARMWAEYGLFNVVVIDIEDKQDIPKGVHFIRCDAKSLAARDAAVNSDVIIDDGSHLNSDIIETFKSLWPQLVPGGLYCVEDLHSSYDYWYEDSDPFLVGAKQTAMSFFLHLAHSVNYSFIREDIADINELYDDISWIHFYKELVIIKKKG